MVKLLKTINIKFNANERTHIVIKLRVKQVTYESKYIMATLKPKENHLGILGSQLGNLSISLEIQQRVSGPGESDAGVMYLSIIKHPKSFASFP